MGLLMPAYEYRPQTGSIKLLVELESAGRVLCRDVAVTTLSAPHMQTGQLAGRCPWWGRA